MRQRFFASLSLGSVGRVLFLCPLLSAATALAGNAIECTLAPDGSITTWLISPAYKPDTTAGFAKDLLPVNAGETSGMRREESEGPVQWRGEAFTAAYVDLSERCRELGGEAIFYAACELRAQKPGTYALEAVHWSNLSVWLDGRPVIEAAGSDNDLFLPRTRAAITLKADQNHYLLVKLGSKGRQALFKLSLLVPADAAEERLDPAPVRCILRVPDNRAGELLAGALELYSTSGGIVRADKAVEMFLGARAGCPLLPGDVEVRASVSDHEGREVKAFEPRTLRAAGIASSPISLAWMVPREPAPPYCTVRAEVRLGGKALREIRQSFYVAEGVARWANLLTRRAQQAELQLGPRGRYTAPDFALARLKLEKASLYARGDGVAGSSPARMIEELRECEAALARLEKGGERPVEKGLAEHAYLSSIDDGPQPYYVFVPAKHDGRTPLPVIVYLHGYNPDLNKLNWQLIPPELLEYCDQHGYYLVAPFARSNTDFQGVGEMDTIEVFRLFAKQYPMDADRVFLLGYSMGAMGAFTIAAHYPDVWAGVISVAGRADYYLWKDLDRRKVEPWKRQLLDMEFGAEMVGNYRNLPMLLYHGSADTLIKVEQSRSLSRRLKGLGADVTYHELEGQDHWIMESVLRDDAIFQWMAARRRDAWPREVDLTAHTIRYRRAYWVTVLELIRWGEPIRVHAKLSADRSVLDVKTENVATLRLDLEKEVVGEKPNLAVLINGKEHKVDALGPATFTIVPVEAAGKRRKTPLLCGPVKEAYNRRFTMVFGLGAGKPEDAERFERDIQQAATEWYAFTKSTPLVRRDTDIDDTDIKTSNLILYGTPSNNTVLAKIADKLPIRITDAGFEFQGKAYDAARHGLVMIYPNPLNPERYVVVRSGRPYGRRLPPNHKLDLLPDFVIFAEGSDYDDTDKAVVAGFFDENWEVAERLIWRRGDKDPDPRTRPAIPPLENER